MTQKEYKVLKIIDGTHIIINAGDDNDIKEGDHFRIIGKKVTNIVDLDTKEDYGPLQPIKAHIMAETIYKKFTICTSIPHISDITAVSSLFRRKEYPELDVNPKDISGGSINDNNPIEVGDTVLEDLGWNTANSSTF